MKSTVFCLLLTLLLSSAFGQYITFHEEPFTDPYSPSGRPRMAAEWEPAIGVLISWPPSLPKDLITELAKDTRLYLLIENRAAQKDAVDVLTKWNVMPDRVKFIPTLMGEDVSWTRDHGPHAVFSHDGQMKLGDPQYLYSTPVTGLDCDSPLTFIYQDDAGQPVLTKNDDRITEFIAQNTGYDDLRLPFAFTGGNVLVDGQRTGFSTCALTNENRFLGISDDQLFLKLHQLLGIQTHHIISNFELDGIQHIDCFMKLLDEERIFVMQPPSDHPMYEQYEGIVQNELTHIRNAYGRPYQILRLQTDRYDGDRLAAYSNSLILNKVIYVPLFGIKQDEIALQQWREAMPGYTVKGFPFVMANEKVLSEQCRQHYKELGWNDGDALHCRTRAIWDPEMLYIAVDKIPELINDASAIHVIIKDYSRKGLLQESLKMKWRFAGENEWKENVIYPSGLTDHYYALWPKEDKNHGEVQFYVTATSASGRTETMPRVAPEGYFSYSVSSH